MKIERIRDGFIVKQKNMLIRQIECNFGGICKVVFFDGNSIEFPVIECSIFNAQYGFPVSKDGKIMFVGTWEKGLYAYDTVSGKQLWHVRKAKIRNIFVREDYIVVLRAYEEIIKIGIFDGSIIAAVRGTTVERMFDLSDQAILVDSLRGKLSVLDPATMEVVRSYSKKVANPDDNCSFVLRDARLEGKKLLITGFEGCPRNMANKTCDVLVTTASFSRVIDPDF